MITKEIALTLRHGQTLYHKSERNKDGTAMRARVSGACQTWKTRPADWRLPMKHGLRSNFSIGPQGNAAPQYTADQWTITEKEPE